MFVEVESHRILGSGEMAVNVHVVLSERNLRDLVAQFEDDRLEGTAPSADLHRRVGNTTLEVVVQGDEAHYGSRTPGIGSGLVPQ
jgi:hypothetical protein